MGLESLNILSGVNSLDVSTNRLTDAGVCAVLQHAPPTLETLDLSHNRPGLESIEAISGILASATSSLTTLNLSDCGLQARALKLLQSGLEPNAALSDLNLSYNPLGSAGAATFASM